MPLIRVGFLPISGIFSGTFFADFGIHSGVISKLSGSIFVSGTLSRHISIAVSFGFDFQFRIRLSAALSDPPVFHIKHPVEDRSNDVSPGIFSGIYFTIFGIHSGIFFTICRYPFGCTFQPHSGTPVPNFFGRTPPPGCSAFFSKIINIFCRVKGLWRILRIHVMTS